MLTRPSFLALMIAPSAASNCSRAMAGDGTAALARLALPDEPRVLGEAAGVEEEPHAAPPADVPRCPQVLQADGLAARRVAGDGAEDQGHPRPLGREQRLEPGEVHVALEGVPARRIRRLGNREVDGPRPRPLDIGAGRVEVGVVRDHPAGAARDLEEHPLARPALVRRQRLVEAGDLAHRLLKPLEAVGPGVALVAAHHRRPLRRAHGAGPAVGQQVDHDVGRRHPEQVEAGPFEDRLALLGRGQPDGLDHLDAERLELRFHVAAFARPSPGRRADGRRVARGMDDPLPSRETRCRRAPESRARDFQRDRRVARSR